MDSNSKKLIDQKFVTLPKALQDALEDDSLETKLEEIAEKHGITSELEFNRSVRAVLLGLSHPKDFIRTISSELSVDATKAAAVAEDVNVSIFRPVKEEIKKLYSITDASAPAVPTPPSRKPLDSELQETVGLKQSAAKPVPEEKKPLDAVLEEALRRKSAPPPPSMPPLRGSDDIDAVRTMERDSKKALGEAVPPGLQHQNHLQGHQNNFSVPTPSPLKPPPPAEHDHEEELDRDEILRGIENPSSIPLRPTPPPPPKSSERPIPPPVPRPTWSDRGVPPPPMPPRANSGYSTDPYREPLE